MTPKEAFEKIKAMFSDNAGAPAMKELKTGDGKVIMCEGEVAMGSKCAMKAADGTMQMLPDGEYTLEDGTVIMVASNAITSVTPPASGANDMSAVTLESLSKKIADLESKNIAPTPQGMSADEKTAFETLRNENASLKQTLTDMVSKFEAFTATVKEGFKLVEIIASEPAGNSNNAPKNNFKSDLNKDKQNRLEAIIGAAQKINLQSNN